MVTTTNVRLAQLIAQLFKLGININHPQGLSERISAKLGHYDLHLREQCDLSAIIADYGEDGYRIWVEIDMISPEQDAKEIARLMEPF